MLQAYFFMLLGTCNISTYVHESLTAVSCQQVAEPLKTCPTALGCLQTLLLFPVNVLA